MNQEDKYLIERIKEYMETCPFFVNLEPFGVDFLSSNLNTSSIEKVPTKKIIESYVDGSSRRQFTFVLASRFNYSDEIRNNIENSGFFENFENWIDENNEDRIFPDLGSDKTVEEIELLTDGYLFNVAEGMNTARYQIQLRIIYEQKSKKGMIL